MNRARLMLCTAVAVLSMGFQFAAAAAETDAKTDAIKIHVATDRQDALYKCGEKVTFKGTVTKNGQPATVGKVVVRLSNDNMKTISTQEIDLAKSNSFTVEGTMNVPGFLQCEASIDKIKGIAAAGLEPEKIKPAAQAPEDFKAFWDNGIKELDKIPLDVKLEKLPKYSTPQFDCFKISFANIDNTRIYGFLSVPKDKKGPFPALVSVPGAGIGYYAPDTGWVRSGIIVLLMNVFPYEPAADEATAKKIYDEMNKPVVYCFQGASDRNKYFFRNAILGINRAINWLAERPDVDKEHFAIYGHSQGGAFTLIMAGLNKNIKAASANVPALCDHSGAMLDRSPGWPRLAGTDPVKQKTASYFDAVNFARNITCPVLASVGFIDATCSPSSVYAAYNTIQSPKMIFNEPTMPHSISKRFRDYQIEWLRGKLGLSRETPPAKK
ncbi:MAG: acetylxylan esterase [Victivallaceae bacterium]